MFHSRYVPLVGRERLAQEYLDLRQGSETVTEITKMFTERAIFCPEFPASEAGSDDTLLVFAKDGDQVVCFYSTLRYIVGEAGCCLAA